MKYPLRLTPDQWEAVRAAAFTNIRRDFKVSTLQRLWDEHQNHTPVSGDQIAITRHTLA